MSNKDEMLDIMFRERLKRDFINSIKSDRTHRKVYRDWETDRKSTRLNSSHSAKSRMPSSA